LHMKHRENWFGGRAAGICVPESFNPVPMHFGHSFVIFLTKEQVAAS